MTSSSQPESFEDIKTVIIRLMNNLEVLKKSNEELKEEISTMKDELKRIKSDDSIKSDKKELTLQTSDENQQQYSEFEEDEPHTDQELFEIEQQIFNIEQENQNEDNFGPNHQNKTHRIKRISSFFSNHGLKNRKLLPYIKTLGGTNSQTSSEEHVYNTGTIYIFAISTAYQSAKNPTLRTRSLMWSMALSSIFFLLMQVFILFILTADANYPACFLNIATANQVECVMDLETNGDNLDVSHVVILSFMNIHVIWM